MIYQSKNGWSDNKDECRFASTSYWVEFSMGGHPNKKLKEFENAYQSLFHTLKIFKSTENDFSSRCKVNDFDTIMILNKYMYTHDKHRRHHYTRSKRLVALLNEEQTLTLLALYGWPAILQKCINKCETQYVNKHSTLLKDFVTCFNFFCANKNGSL